MALGGLLVALVCAVGLASAKRAKRDRAAQSQLLPLLAREVVDADLQVLYHKTLLFDAMCARHHPGLAGPAGTPAGQRMRRLLLRIQCQRHADGPALPVEALREAVDAAIDQVETLAPDALDARLERVEADLGALCVGAGRRF